MYGFLAGGLVMYFMTHSDFIQNHASTPLHGPIFHINRLKKFTIYQGDYCVEDANSDEESDEEGQSEPEEHEEYSEDEGQSEHSEDEGQSDPEEHEEHSEDEGQSESEEENPNELPKENDSDAELVNFDSKMEGSWSSVLSFLKWIWSQPVQQLLVTSIHPVVRFPGFELIENVKECDPITILFDHSNPIMCAVLMTSTCVRCVPIKMNAIEANWKQTCLPKILP